MSSEKIIQRLAKAMDRRSFLGKAGAGALGTLMALLGFPQDVSAHYIHYKCCHICNSNSSSCGSCACTWCWRCCYNGQNIRCCECYSYNQPNCGIGDCPAYCSWTYVEPGTCP